MWYRCILSVSAGEPRKDCILATNLLEAARKMSCLETLFPTRIPRYTYVCMTGHPFQREGGGRSGLRGMTPHLDWLTLKFVALPNLSIHLWIATRVSRSSEPNARSSA